MYIRQQHSLPRIRRLMLALGSVLLMTAALWSLRHLLASGNLLLCYVPLVLIIAIRLGRMAAVAASFAAFLAYNFFFVPPLYTLAVEQPQDVIELGIFLGISVLSGTLAARERRLALEAAQRAARMTALYHLSQKVSAAVDGAHSLRPIAETTQRIVGADGVEIVLEAYDAHPATVEQVGTCVGAPARCVPIAANGQRWGELRLWETTPPEAAAETTTLLMTTANHLALAIARSHAAAAALQTEALREADRLKSALLSSVSHDLRTPLAAIKGAASNLLDPGMAWDAATQRVFAETIVAEADRLNRVMRNMLEMSRLEAGTLRRQRTPYDIGDVIVPTVKQFRTGLDAHPVELDIAPDLPPVLMDAVQIELVLTNLLENAQKFAPVGTPISIQARQCGPEVCISVADRGSGIPPDALERIFDKFYRVAGPERGPSGTGLGLSICKGIVEAHGGRIWAENRQNGGTSISFTLPALLSLPPTTTDPAWSVKEA